MNNTTHISLVSDQRYTQHLAVVLASLFSNSLHKDNKIIHIVDDGISKEDRDELEKIVKENDSQIRFYKCDPYIYRNLKVSDHVSRATYLRLSLPDLLRDVNKVLHLDCDIVCLGDVDMIFNKNLDKTFGAVRDFGIVQVKHLDIPDKKYYFNAGVLLIDLEKYRKTDAKKKILNFINTNGSKIVMWDQDILNAIFWKDWQDIGIECNLQTSFLESVKVRDLSNPPIVIHFSGHSKPWQNFCKHPYKREYYKYLPLTKYKSFKLKSPTLKQYIHFLYGKIFPKSLLKFIRTYILEPLKIPKGYLRS